MIEMFVGRIPGLPKRLGTRGVCALLDEPLLAALDLAGPTAAERRTVEGALKLRPRPPALPAAAEAAPADRAVPPDVPEGLPGGGARPAARCRLTRLPCEGTGG